MGKVLYRDFEIGFSDSAAPLSMQYQYVHKDYDGPEDNRYGHCASISECIAEIEERFYDL